MYNTGSTSLTTLLNLRSLAVYKKRMWIPAEQVTVSTEIHEKVPQHIRKIKQVKLHRQENILTF